MLSPNTVLQNRYQVIRLLAQGGMGAVYEAKDQRLGSTVALKETFFTDDEMREAFHREASLLAGLRHQSLPKVSDHFSEGEGQFLVMEFIRGDDLAKLLEMHRRALPPRDVLIWGDQLLGALDYIHSQKPPIIHRDIKPQNVKLNERGEVILLDFGLAKGSAGDTMKSSLSVRGYTLSYAPLEQIQGMGTDPRSDLYSLAATLYHLMTGIAPPDAVTRASALVHQQPDPLRPASEINPQISPAVAAVLQQAMAQDRNQRPQTAGQFRNALRQAANVPYQPAAQNITDSGKINPVTAQASHAPFTRPDTATPIVGASASAIPATQPTATPKRNRLWLWLAASAIMMLAIIIGGIALWPRTARTPARKTPSSTTTTPTTADFKNALPLLTDAVLVRGGQEDRFYKFTVQPGELRVQLNVIGSNASVEILDSEKKPLRFANGKTSLMASSFGFNEEARAKLLPDREQPALLHLKTPFPQDIQAVRVQLTGAYKPAEGQLSEADNNAAYALRPFFEPRDLPAVLSAKEVSGGQGMKESYFQFTAGPGEIRLSLNVIGSGSTVDVDVYDENAEEIRFNNNSKNFSVSSTGLNDQGVAKFILDRQQPLLLRVRSNSPKDIRAFRLRLDGPLSLAEANPDGDAAKAAQALAPLFADRDKPAALTTKELSGRSPGKESYYTFTALPGTLKLTLDVEGGGAGVTAELFDSDSQKLKFDGTSASLLVSSAGKPEQKSASLIFDREQSVLLRLSCNFPDSMKSYRLQLDGAMK